MNRIRSVVFISNYLTPHQSALSDALWKITEGNYTFIETIPIEKKTQELGKMPENRPYVLTYSTNKDVASALIRNGDIVISGSAPEHLVRERVKQGKLLFRYSERPLKKGLEIWKYPYRFLRWHWNNPFWKPIYMLCASAYTAQDYGKFGLFKNKTYKWGYFPETKEYPDLNERIERKETTEILWCGRFLEWKHPDDALTVAKWLKDEGYCFRMNFIGTGVLEEKMERLIQEYGLEDCVALLGKMTPEQVRKHMEHAGIYLFTSDRQEGWGAVLNESMNSGCAVIASHAIGSVPYLLEDGENGMVYESGNVEMLYEKVKLLLERPAEQRRLGMTAYETIANVWNAENAAKRFLALSEKLLNGERNTVQFESGPCSHAD